jgi:energy-converting hydrogenase Eha subunit C
MRSVRFPAMGFERTYLEFYSGFGWSITAGFLFQAVIAYQVSAIGRRDPKQAIPMAVALLASGLATAVLSWMYFFTAPIVISMAAVTCSGVAVALLARDAAA